MAGSNGKWFNNDNLIDRQADTRSGIQRCTVATTIVVSLMIWATSSTTHGRDADTGETGTETVAETTSELSQRQQRTRTQIRMLDDIYKGSIVTITKHYVNDDQTIPAGTAFKQLFAAVAENGWHQVRLLDATGLPTNDENIPQSGFETDAINALLAGKRWYERPIKIKGKDHLLVATPIPVVMEKCVMCHDHYADVPEGRAIGALSYRVPLVD